MRGTLSKFWNVIIHTLVKTISPVTDCLNSFYRHTHTHTQLAASTTDILQPPDVKNIRTGAVTNK